MNPFEEGMVIAKGMNSSSTKWTVRKETRIIQKKEYLQFYNPMWGLFGDRTPGSPGTYYLAKGTLCYYWNMFDQVLLRPGLAETLTELEIVEAAGEMSLVTKNGLPNRIEYSDHLPLFFSLDLDRIQESS